MPPPCVEVIFGQHGLKRVSHDEHGLPKLASEVRADAAVRLGHEGCPVVRRDLRGAAGESGGEGAVLGTSESGQDEKGRQIFPMNVSYTVIHRIITERVYPPPNPVPEKIQTLASRAKKFPNKFRCGNKN